MSTWHFAFHQFGSGFQLLFLAFWQEAVCTVMTIYPYIPFWTSSHSTAHLEHIPENKANQQQGWNCSSCVTFLTGYIKDNSIARLCSMLYFTAKNVLEFTIFTKFSFSMWLTVFNANAWNTWTAWTSSFNEKGTLTIHVSHLWNFCSWLTVLEN